MVELTRRALGKAFAAIALLGPLSVRGAGKVKEVAAKTTQVARSGVTIMMDKGKTILRIGRRNG